MAYKMKLAKPHQGMPFIWNISASVGAKAAASKTCRAMWRWCST